MADTGHERVVTAWESHHHRGGRETLSANEGRSESNAVGKIVDTGESPSTVLAHGVLRGYQDRNLHERIRDECAERPSPQREVHGGGENDVRE